MSFVVIAFFAVGAAVFLIGKASEAANEIDLLNNGPLAVRRVALLHELGREATGSGVETGNTSNWKTYRNEKYGFEVKYPSGKDVRDFTARNTPYYPKLVLVIGFCDPDIGVDCVGGKVNIFSGKQEWASATKTFYKGDYTFIIEGDKDVILTFKFIK